MRLQERSRRELRQRSRTRSHGRRSDREASEPPQERPRKRQKRAVQNAPVRTKQAAHSDSEEPAPPPTKAEGKKAKAKVKLYKMGEFCCNIVANYVQGKEAPEHLVQKLHIDQRTKIDHCRSHLERAGALATVWHFSAADRRDCAAYDALCDYFVEKQRVGLVQTPSYYIYIVPPTEQYFKALGLPTLRYSLMEKKTWPRLSAKPCLSQRTSPESEPGWQPSAAALAARRRAMATASAAPGMSPRLGREVFAATLAARY